MKVGKVSLKIIKNQNGFTLLEVLVSLAILVVIVGPFLGIIVSAGRDNSMAEKRLKATALAQEMMEVFKTQPVSIDPLTHNPVNLHATKGRMTAEGVIQRISQGSISAGSLDYTYDNAVLPSDYFFTIDRSNSSLIIKDVIGNFNNEDSFKLVIDNAQNYKLYVASSTDSVKDGTLTADPGGVFNIYTKFINPGDNDKPFRLYVDSSLDDTFKLNFYFVDDMNPSKVRITNIGNKPFYCFTGLKSSVDEKYNNNLYGITITVTEDGETLATMSTYSKK